MLFRATPFLGLIMIVYALFLYGGAAFGSKEFVFSKFLLEPLLTITLPSGDPWDLSWGDLFVIIGLFMLGLESLKSTSSGKVSMINHMLSMLVFLAGGIVFLLVAGFGTTTFFLLVCMALIDTMVGMLTSVVTARRDFGIAAPGIIPGSD